jgi:hypothetical protein
MSDLVRRMSNNVVSLTGVMPTRLGEPNDALVQALEQALAMAKAGQLQSLIGTGFVSDGSRFSIWAGEHENVYEMLGSIAWLQHEYVDRTTGDAE